MVDVSVCLFRQSMSAAIGRVRVSEKKKKKNNKSCVFDTVSVTCEWAPNGASSASSDEPPSPTFSDLILLL